MSGNNSEKKQTDCIRICVLIDAWEPVWGGGQTHVWELATRLVKEYNCKIDIYTRSLIGVKNKKHTRVENYFRGNLQIIRLGSPTDFFNLWGRFSWLVLVIWVVFRKHRVRQYQLIHAHAYSSGLPAKLLSLVLNLPVIFTVHGSNNLDLHKKNLATWIENILLTKIYYDQEISVSRHFLSYPNVNQDIAVIPNGVPETFLKTSNLVERQDEKFRLLWVGRLDKIKAVDLLLKALVLIIKADADTELQIVGVGPEEGYLRKFCTDLQLNSHVTFTGWKPISSLIALYKKADLFVLPSLSEGQPITLLEAWAVKLPVVVTNVGDNALVVKNGINGYLVPAGNVVSLATAITQAYANPKLKQLGQAGYMVVKKHFTWEESTRKTFAIYQRLLFFKKT